LTLCATLGIPRLSVGSEAVCVGTDRLALAARTRGQRLAVGAEPRFAGRTGLAGRARLAGGTGLAGRTGLLRQRLPVGTEARLGGAARASRAAEVATVTARTARTSITAWTTRTAATRTWTTRTTIAARTTGTATATRTTATTTAAFTTEVAGCCGQLPANPCARHLAATGTIVVLLVFFWRADLEAAEAARLVATTIATRTAAATTTTITAIATATTAITAIATTTRGTGDAVDDVVELAARDRAVRTLLALEHAHEANLIDAVSDDVERFDQSRGAIGLHVERCGERLHRRIALGRRRCRLRDRRRFTAAFARLHRVRRFHRFRRFAAFARFASRRRFTAGFRGAVRSGNFGVRR